MNLQTLLQNEYVLITLGLWDVAWRGFALWKAAKNNQKYWFIPLLLVNSIGLLPIIYLSIEWYKNKDLKKLSVCSRLKKVFKIK